MRNLSEVHGIDLIRRVARRKIERPEVRSRVWSEEMHSWGFFADHPNEGDVFLIMGCSNPGDMLIPRKHAQYLFTVPGCTFLQCASENDPYVVLELKQFYIDGMSMYGLELLSSNPPMVCQVLAQHKVLFKIAWESL
jgi:hypothetical protein